VFNPYRKDWIRRVFPGGAKITDTPACWKATTQTEGIALFCGMPDVKSKREALQRAIKRRLR
jgi:hypothetical protein